MSLTTIRSRRDLARHLQAQLAASRSPWGDQGDDVETAGRHSVKTYLLEAHAKQAGSAESCAALLGEVAPRIGGRVEPTEDPDLWLLSDDEVEFWCDVSRRRFWRLHTVAPVRPADRLRSRLVAATTLLDNVWLPPDLLEELPTLAGGRMLTFALSHDRRPLLGVEEDEEDFNYISLRLWATRAEEQLRKIRESGIFEHGVSTRSVRIRSGDEEAEGGYCLAEFFRDGKVTASGTSYDELTRVLIAVLDRYQELVEGIERRYGLGHTRHDDGPTPVSGDPVTIELDWTMADLEHTVGRIFSSAEPFRLWALPERLSSIHYRARAVDLHVGSTLTFDVTPEHVVIQLPQGTCGNTILRFLANLQYHVNADAGRRLVN